MIPRPLVLAPFAVLLASCGHSPATTFLVIDAAPPAATRGTYAGPPLRVPFVHLPVTIDRPELVREETAGTLRIDDFARWSAPLGLMARNTLIADLVARLPAGGVLPPDAAPAPREVRVEATILDAHFVGSEGTMLVSWRLVRPSMPDARSQVVRLTTPLGTGDAAQAQAWGRLLGDLADRIVAAL